MYLLEKKKCQFYVVITGGCKHQQIPAYPWKGHLCPVGTVTDQQEGLHTVQRVCPDMVRN